LNFLTHCKDSDRLAKMFRHLLPLSASLLLCLCQLLAFRPIFMQKNVYKLQIVDDKLIGRPPVALMATTDMPPEIKTKEDGSRVYEPRTNKVLPRDGHSYSHNYHDQDLHRSNHHYNNHNRTRNNSKGKKSKVNNNGQTRFIHPQVLKMFKRAQALMKSGDNEVAQRLLVRCLELNPYDSHSWLALAQLEAKLGNIERAKDLFQQSVTRCPNNVFLLHAWGHLEQKYGSEMVARDCWSQAVEIDPLNAYVCYALSDLEKRLGHFDRAREILETVVRKRPTAAICVSLADLERQEGNPEKAREVLRYGLDTCNKDRSKVLLELAWIEEDVFQNEEEARNLVEEALEIDGRNVRVYVAKASMELRMRKLEDARKTLLDATKFEAEDAQHYTMLSTLEIEAGNSNEARKILKEGSMKYPGDHYLLQRWGSLEEKLGNTDMARKMYEKSVRILPHAPTFVAWGILEEEIGMRKLNEAINNENVFVNNSDNSGFLEFVKDDLDSGLLEDIMDLPESISSIIDDRTTSTTHVDNVVAEEFALQQLRKARHLLGLGLVVDPQHGPLYHAYGNMELRNGNFTGARDIFIMGITKNASDVTSLYHAWGMLELRLGHKDDAADIFRRGMELGLKGNREVDNGVGFLLHSLGTLEADNHRPEEAKKVFMTGASLFPNHSQILLGLALACMKLGQYAEARESFKASVDADPFHAHAWQSWGLAEKQCGNIELARILFRQGLKKVPSHGPLWQASAVMEMQQGNIDVARTLFAQALSRCPDHEQSYQAWACLEVRTGNLVKAKALALQGIRRAPGHPALWTVAALIEDRLGERDKARALLKTAIKKFPDHGPLYKVLGEQYERDGSYTEARDVFVRGLEHDPLCAPVYHAAALLEARLGNLEALSEMHKKAQSNLLVSRAAETDTLDIVEKISQLVEIASSNSIVELSNGESDIIVNDSEEANFGEVFLDIENII
jgi:tetratricopeptide (TPR) repeat protein